MVVVYIRARGSSRVPTQRATLQELRRATFAALLPLLMPAIIVVGVLGGIATPTEVSSFAVVYGLLLAMPLYREMDIRKLLNAAVNSTSTSEPDPADLRHGHDVLLDPDDRLSAPAPGGSADHCSSNSLAVPDRLDCAPDRAWLDLEGLPALLILAPLLLPIASDMGISQLHFGIVLLIAMAIGAFAPPVGAGFYISCAVLGTTVERSSKAMVPYFIVLCIGVVLVGLVPWFTIVLPRAFPLVTYDKVLPPLGAQKKLRKSRRTNAKVSRCWLAQTYLPPSFAPFAILKVRTCAQASSDNAVSIRDHVLLKPDQCSD